MLGAVTTLLSDSSVVVSLLYWMRLFVDGGEEC